MTATLLLEEVSTDTTAPANQLSPTADDGIHQIITLCNYSNLTKLIRVTAYVLRFVHNCRHSSNQVGALTSEEQKTAKLLWLHNTQQQAFRREIANIRSNSQCLPLVRQLRLFLD